MKKKSHQILNTYIQLPNKIRFLYPLKLLMAKNQI